ncbi:DUF1572 family protein [Thermaerobacillus caldiproteolyticus]|uniref:DUF1572 family protein n=1 Tax=Thermaerobacillus caldiproteolyticus TaxID=247480 RepID=UPI00188A90A9|nr:DUF1572 family protein [Anoxybacillus caldiproteolyticus]QPA33133.1 DUF1572 family protein [Anoxybacillus caldiproteolyticus]
MHSFALHNNPVVKHISGNTISRCTGFFISDGEKTNRNREDGIPLIAEKRWGTFFCLFLEIIKK